MNSLFGMRISPLVVLLLLVTTGAIAQNPSKDYTEASNHFYTERLDLAMPYFEDLADKKFQDSEYLYEIIYLLLIDPSKSLDDLDRLYEEISYSDSDYFYWLGRIFHRKNKLDSAMFFYEQFLAESTRWMDAAFLLEVEDRMAMTERAREMMANPGEYDVLHLPQAVNSTHADLSPAFFEQNNELLFMSSRDGTLRGKDFKIFHSINQDGTWPLNAMMDHLGTFSRDNSKIEMVNEAAKLYIFDPESGLKYSEGRSSEWSNPQILDTEITRIKAQSHFYINDNENRIIFSSAENLKKKGYDLYESRKDPNTGEWSIPVPLPDIINSPEDEDSPYLSPDEQILYFSSKGHESMGGKDIFRSFWDAEAGTWTAPENMGYPLNSTGDEIHFEVSQDGKSGYFSSNRMGTLGDFDIYYFWEKQEIKLNGQVLAEGILPISQAEVRLELAMSREENFSTHTSDSGYYELPINPMKKYRIVITKHGEEIHKEDFTIVSPDHPEFHLKNFNIAEYMEDLDTRIAGTNEPAALPPPPPSPGLSDNDLQQYYSAKSKALANNVYFRFGSIEPKSIEVLKLIRDFLQLQQSISVEIAGHTDSIGTEDWNMGLSLNRAKKVKEWLVNAGISSDRISVKGYGEFIPLATNDDEREGRELNRRIEVLLLSNYKSPDGSP